MRHARLVSEAKKKALYETSVKIGDSHEVEDADGAAEEAPAAAALSQMKRLELSGTAGNILEPREEVKLK
jgi:hypothetical protein